ncbi:MAG: hypothetical protein ACTHU0_15835 [Kofleriaceae bacterium]
MIRVVEISIEGKSDLGPFSGRLAFEDKVHVISGGNRFGKSTAFAGIAWCLGVEHIYGVQASDVAIFPEAPRSQLTLGSATDVRVVSSYATLVLQRADGRRLKLGRDIVGQPTQVRFDDGELAGTLVVGYGSMRDPTAGFQAALRKWIGMPEARLMTARGGEAQIYMENLAPLFLIEQLAGWSDIQAEQIYRYGTQEVADGAFEFLLGLDNELTWRLARQRRESVAAAAREEAGALSTALTDLLRRREGWTFDLGTKGTLEALAARWGNIDLLSTMKERFQFDPAKETARLGKRIEELRTRVTKGKTDQEATSNVSAASGAVVTLKQRRHELQVRLASLRAQLRDQQRLLRTVEDRLKSAKDLRRLKADGIGILPKAECPTCHQSVDPEMLDLHQQSTMSLDLHIGQLDHQRKHLGHSVEALHAEVIEASVQAEVLERDFIQAERTLQLVNESTSPLREAMIKATNDLLAAEQELARIRNLRDDINSIEERMRAWSTRTMATFGPQQETDGTSSTDAFLAKLRQHLVALGCAGVTTKDAPSVELDEHYLPTLRSRWVRSLGSASDRARLIVAYTLALLETGAHHPGFVAYDEPLQQNPDPDHRSRFIKFLLERGPSIKRQVLVFTSFSDSEVAQLREAGVSVQLVEGKFLRPVEQTGQ